MPIVVTQIEIELPDHLLTIEEGSFWRYLAWQNDRAELDRRIRTKFKEGALATTSYSDDARPAHKAETPLKIGQLEFIITTTPTTKHPAYSTINVEFGNFLQQFKEQYDKGLLGKGYRTLQGEAYIDLDVLIEKLEGDVKTLLEGKAGVQQKIALVKPQELITNVPNIISIVLGRDYSALSEYNGRMFIGAENMIKEGDGRTVGYKEGSIEVKRFKKLLLDDSLQTIGAYPKAPTVVAYPFDEFTFVHQLEPRTRHEYGEIIAAFLKGFPTRIARNSKIGDFIKIKEMMQDEALRKKLVESGLVDESFSRDYNPTRRDKVIYVRLQGVIDRLERYRKDTINPYLEQNIFLKRHKF